MENNDHAENKVRKVVIIGHPEVSVGRMSYAASYIGNTEITLFDNSDNVRDSIGTDLSAFFPKQEDTYIIQPVPRINEPFYPKQKHLPKCHQRPYKFHR